MAIEVNPSNPALAILQIWGNASWKPEMHPFTLSSSDISNASGTSIALN
jgi:hypothetical protein